MTSRALLAASRDSRAAEIIRSHPVAAFFVLAYAVSWALLLVVDGLSGADPAFGAIAILLIVATRGRLGYAPGAVAA